MHLVLACSALARLFRNFDDDKAGADLLWSTSGDSWVRLFARWRRTNTGQTVTARELDLPRRLFDEEYLLSLPDDSLGHAYYVWVQFDADVFQRSLERAIPLPSFDEDLIRFYRREKAAFDLVHIVTGYPSDLWGLTCLAFFMWPQHRNTGLIIPMIVGGLLNFRRWRELRDVLRASRRAAWFPGVLWEEMLGRPLAEVRLDLGAGTDDA